MKTTFKESQKFRQWWLWILILPLVILPIVLVVQQLILGKPIGSKPLPDAGVIAFSIFCLCISGLFLSMCLKTTINDKGLFVNYRPFLKRRYLWKDIQNIEVIDYGFVGYGFRWRPKHGWIYNVGGNMGLKIYLNSGKQVTIGTQKADELARFISSNYSSATI